MSLVKVNFGYAHGLVIFWVKDKEISVNSEHDTAPSVLVEPIAGRKNFVAKSADRELAVLFDAAEASQTVVYPLPRLYDMATLERDYGHNFHMLREEFFKHFRIAQ